MQQQNPRPVRRRQTGQQQFLYGLMLTILGIVLTVVVRFIADATGSSFTLIFPVMIIGGVIYMLVGLFRMIAKR